MRFYHNHIMLTIKEPSTLNRSWRLSSCQESQSVSISKDLTKLLENYHLIGIEFLYNNYKNGLNGCILNQEYDMNIPLEITAFLSAIFRDIGIVLIICPDLLLYTWHYYLNNHGKYNTKVITIDNFNTILTESQQSQTVLLITFSKLKLLETLSDCQYFCLIIDELDKIATKSILNKLKTHYNIGITYNNFYEIINPKLQWKLLNWSNPGCVGQISKFPQVDNENFRQFRDNYHYWWLRLTWQFNDDDVDHFQKPTQIEIDNLNKIIENWTKLHFPNDQNNNDKNIVRKDRSKCKRKSGESTVKSRKKLKDYVQLPSMEEDPILTSIQRKLETTTPEPIRICNDNDNKPSASARLKHSESETTPELGSIQICDDNDNNEDNGNKPTAPESLKHNESEYFLFNLVGNPQDNDEFIDDKNEDLNERIQRTLKEADDLLGD